MTTRRRVHLLKFHGVLAFNNEDVFLEDLTAVIFDNEDLVMMRGNRAERHALDRFVSWYVLPQ